MMREVFIVGVNHCWQQLPNCSIGQPSVEDPKTGLREITPEEFTAFDEFVSDTIHQHHVKTIVEEATGSPHLRMSKLAKELALRHYYCELSQPERDRRGIKTNAEREKHWVSVLDGVEEFPVLMICGADHVESFTTLLQNAGYAPTIIVKDYEEGIL